MFFFLEPRLDEDMSVEAQIGRQRYSQQTDVVTSYYGVGTEL